jgi:hypothetical protein
VLGDVFARQALYGEALERFREARELDPREWRARVGETRMLLALARFAEACTVAHALHADWPGRRRGARARRGGQRGAGEPDAAVLLERAELSATSAESWREIATRGACSARRPPPRARTRGPCRSRPRPPCDWRTRAPSRRPGATADAERELAASCAMCRSSATRRSSSPPCGATRPHTATPRAARARAGASIRTTSTRSRCSPTCSCSPTGRRDAAIAVARVLRFDPEHAGALCVDGALLLHDGRIAEACERWDQVVGLEPAGRRRSACPASAPGSEARVVNLHGPLRELGLDDVFQLLERGRRTGALRVTSDLREDEGVVYFDAGRVYHATVRSAPEPARVGRGADERVRRDHIESVVMELMNWREGYFSFERARRRRHVDRSAHRRGRAAHGRRAARRHVGARGPLHRHARRRADARADAGRGHAGAAAERVGDPRPRRRRARPARHRRRCRASRASRSPRPSPRSARPASCGWRAPRPRAPRRPRRGAAGGMIVVIAAAARGPRVSPPAHD